VSYRDHRPDPPLCDCGEPAVSFAEMFGVFVCPRRHLFDADLDRFRFCKLAGPEQLDALPEPELTAWERISRWWLGAAA